MLHKKLENYPTQPAEWSNGEKLGGHKGKKLRLVAGSRPGGKGPLYKVFFRREGGKKGPKQRTTGKKGHDPLFMKKVPWSKRNQGQVPEKGGSNAKNLSEIGALKDGHQCLSKEPNIQKAAGIGFGVGRSNLIAA